MFVEVHIYEISQPVGTLVSLWTVPETKIKQGGVLTVSYRTSNPPPSPLIGRWGVLYFFAYTSRQCGRRLRRGYYKAVLMICVVSWPERTACCGTGCSRPGSARNGLQVRVSVGTQCSHQQRQRFSYSTAGTLCYFVAAFQDLPLILH